MPSRPVLIGRGLVPHTTKTLTTHTPTPGVWQKSDLQVLRVHYPDPDQQTHPGPTQKQGPPGGTTTEQLVTRVTAAIANGKHPDPYRTRKLSRSAPMVLQPTGCGRVGRRRTYTRWRPPVAGGLHVISPQIRRR